ncbi:MAG: 2-C-methyl-D-erythritol 2,4-cyclodiphosphate synthase [Acidobacteria bacterium]|nr:2-C-methyl-D-erythritol 2,4-cyclodiphosphate synthase [Acidobacteriota bacterium]MBV9068292.1 2-C-methyl-D-erythritol 2,4-cyclodiphosphate synthase [Acidobacteriota bacterium]MBV9184473.1 2-C-methyl-D-erythritol 2,4-cyclodiphosphate synthase [Acidobacteriota bacterium]
MIRVGQGIDVHAFDETRPLTLGGIRISDTGGLAGHSDADAVLHAITDALLGAAGAGDIGQYFPSDDARWKDADSALFLREAKRVVDEMDADIANVDVTIIAEKPKLAPFRDAIQASIARLLDLPAGHVNVKATTTDHLGFIGRGEGICAMAITCISL